MALSFEQFVELTGCEIVAGNLIVGIQANRKILGSVLDGTFNLNEEGQAVAAELEAAAAEKPSRRSKKADEPAPAAAEGEAAA